MTVYRCGASTVHRKRRWICSVTVFWLFAGRRTARNWQHLARIRFCDCLNSLANIPTNRQWHVWLRMLVVEIMCTAGKRSSRVDSRCSYCIRVRGSRSCCCRLQPVNFDEFTSIKYQLCSDSGRQLSLYDAHSLEHLATEVMESASQLPAPVICPDSCVLWLPARGQRAIPMYEVRTDEMFDIFFLNRALSGESHRAASSPTVRVRRAEHERHAGFCSATA